MITRCVCGKIASTKRPCRSCGNGYPMVHCHNRAHRTHSFRGYRGVGYDNEDLGPCTDWHAHPYDDIEHLNEPSHEVKGRS